MDKAIVILSGDPFYRREERKIVLSSVPSTRSEILLSSPEIEELNRECLAKSLFGRFKVIRIEGLVCKKDTYELFSRFLAINNSNCLILIEESDYEKAQTIEKKLSGLGFSGKVELRSLPSGMKPKQRVKFVQEHASENGLIIQSDAAETLLSFCDDNLSIVHEELIKLKLLFEDEVNKKDIVNFVTPIGESADSIKFYIAIMSGDPVQSISVARKISSEEGIETILGCLVRLSYLSLLLCYANGNDKSILDFLKKKRGKLDLKWTLNDDESVYSKTNPPPSQFVMRVAKKLYDRVSSRNIWFNLFTQCYGSYLEYRVNGNENVASANMEKVIALISRS